MQNKCSFDTPYYYAAFSGSCSVSVCTPESACTSKMVERVDRGKEFDKSANMLAGFEGQLWTVAWNYFSIPKLQRLHRWRLEKDK